MTYGENVAISNQANDRSGDNDIEDDTMSFKTKLLAKREEILRISDPCAIERNGEDL